MTDGAGGSGRKGGRGGPIGKRPGGGGGYKGGGRPTGGKRSTYGKPSGAARPDQGYRADRPRSERMRSDQKVSLDGLVAREVAVDVLGRVLDDGRPLDEALNAAANALPPLDARAFEPRDRAFARAIAMTVLRRRGQLYDLVGRFLEHGLPRGSGPLPHILNAAAAQLVFLDAPPHAVIHLAVEQCKRGGGSRRYDRLANAVLRRVAEQGKAVAASQDAVALNMPRWLMARWEANYGGDLAQAIARASLAEPPLDLAVKSDGAGWAERLGGRLLATGAVRLNDAGRIDDLAGYADGAWWVQDAAAQLPARLLGDVAGLSVADLCAAPGGKTAELAAAGARVTALDQSETRLALLRANLARLKLDAEVVAGDVATWQPPAPFDGVLLDAPCSATGTIRRHPDILVSKHRSDIARLVEMQARLLEAALAMTRPGGRLVYCVCSLEPEEGPDQVDRLLAAHPGVQRVAITAGEAGVEPGWITASGDLRTLPSHMAAEGGMDGFYAARLVRNG